MNIVDENDQQSPYPTNPNQISKSQTCTIVITDPPPGVDLGIDCMNYETGKDFRGFQQVPEGLHFIYHSTGMGAR
jgi:AAR2 protein